MSQNSNPLRPIDSSPVSIGGSEARAQGVRLSPEATEHVALAASDSVLGIGTDIVFVPDFAEQLSSPGSRLVGGIFTAKELRRAKSRAAAKGDSEAVHLAAVWAIKESVIKAWVSALAHRGEAAPLHQDAVDWTQIEVTHGVDGEPSVALRGELAQVFSRSFPELAADKSRPNPKAVASLSDSQEGTSRPDSQATTPPPDPQEATPLPERNAGWKPRPAVWHVSASHDGDYALAFVVLE